MRLRNRKGTRGQAMVEYSMINWLLIVGLVLASTVRMIPSGVNQFGVIQKRNVIEMFLEAYQTYYDSFYFVLNMPFP
jgi:hypothetical protein